MISYFISCDFRRIFFFLRRKPIFLFIVSVKWHVFRHSSSFHGTWMGHNLNIVLHRRFEAIGGERYTKNDGLESTLYILNGHDVSAVLSKNCSFGSVKGPFELYVGSTTTNIHVIMRQMNVRLQFTGSLMHYARTDSRLFKPLHNSCYRICNQQINK